MIKWALENGFQIYEHTYMWAALKGHINVLQYLYENGYPLNTDENICTAAARGGKLETLVWLHEIGCPWDTYTCTVAALGGHLEVLRYLHEQGCPWNSNVCLFAAERGHHVVLQYALENGCPE